MPGGFGNPRHSRLGGLRYGFRTWHRPCGRRPGLARLPPFTANFGLHCLGRAEEPGEVRAFLKAMVAEQEMPDRDAGNRARIAPPRRAGCPGASGSPRLRLAQSLLSSDGSRMKSGVPEAEGTDSTVTNSGRHSMPDILCTTKYMTARTCFCSVYRFGRSPPGAGTGRSSGQETGPLRSSLGCQQAAIKHNTLLLSVLH